MNPDVEDPCSVFGRMNNFSLQQHEYFLICEIKKNDNDKMQESFGKKLNKLYMEWVEEL